MHSQSMTRRTGLLGIGLAMMLGAAGCATVLKGSEIAPLTSYLVADLAQQTGIAAGVFNLVSGTGPVVGEAIAAHPLVDMVSLTGSVRAGSRVMELASQSIKRVGLELGGKSANVILDDADVEKAVSVGIVDALRNGGQACGGLTRVLVPRPKLGAAEEAAASAAATFRLGDPLDPATTMGPILASVLARLRSKSKVRQSQFGSSNTKYLNSSSARRAGSGPPARAGQPSSPPGGIPGKISCPVRGFLAGV